MKKKDEKKKDGGGFEKAGPTKPEKKGAAAVTAVKEAPKKSKYGEFDGLFPHIEKIRTTLGLLLKTKLFETTSKFIKCYKNAKDVGDGAKKY